MTPIGGELGAPDLSGIAIVGTTEYFPWLSSGGTDHVAWQVARRFVSYGASFTMIAGVPADARSTTIDRVVDGVNAIALPTVDVGRRLGVELVAPRGAKLALGRANRDGRSVFYASGLHFPITWSLVRAAKATRTPLVTTCHVGEVPLSTWSLRIAAQMYEASVGRWILRSSVQVIAVADQVKEHVAPLAGNTPITVVPNGVDTTRFRLAERAGTPRIVFVGRLIANKGPNELLDALAELHVAGDQFEAVFVGEGTLRKTLCDRVRALGLAERITFTGHVTDVAPYLRTGDIFVRPSLSEGMPLATLEAMAAGCCVVATDVPGNSELIGRNEFGLLVPVGDKGALVHALRSLLTEPGLRTRLSVAAATAAQAYSWDATAEASARVVLRAEQDPPS